MRVYKLAAPYHRSYVDLRDFKDIIKQAVHQEVPDAKVVVKEDCYEIDKDISQGDAIRIGRTLASGELGQYCLQRATCYCSSVTQLKQQKKNIRNNKREE